MKIWQIALGIGVVALTLGAAGVAYAQVDDPPPPPYGGGYGKGPGSGSCDAEGPMHEGMIEALAAELGLGLAITRELVEAHGGSIKVSNRQGGGTVFSIELPSTD